MYNQRPLKIDVFFTFKVVLFSVIINIQERIRNYFDCSIIENKKILDEPNLNDLNSLINRINLLGSNHYKRERFAIFLVKKIINQII